jgi:hypothetical protein
MVSRCTEITMHARRQQISLDIHSSEIFQTRRPTPAQSPIELCSAKLVGPQPWLRKTGPYGHDYDDMSRLSAFPFYSYLFFYQLCRQWSYSFCFQSFSILFFYIMIGIVPFPSFFCWLRQCRYSFFPPSFPHPRTVSKYRFCI